MISFLVSSMSSPPQEKTMQEEIADKLFEVWATASTIVDDTQQKVLDKIAEQDIQLPSFEELATKAQETYQTTCVAMNVCSSYAKAHYAMTREYLGPEVGAYLESVEDGVNYSLDLALQKGYVVLDQTDGLFYQAGDLMGQEYSDKVVTFYNKTIFRDVRPALFLLCMVCLFLFQRLLFSCCCPKRSKPQNVFADIKSPKSNGAKSNGSGNGVEKRKFNKKDKHKGPQPKPMPK